VEATAVAVVGPAEEDSDIAVVEEVQGSIILSVQGQ